MNTSWEGNRVFITGCTGFVGYWLAEFFVSRGAVVTGLVRDFVPESSFFRFELNKRINIVNGSLEDFSLLERTINEYEVDTVYHLGAQTQIGVGNRSPLATFETNIRGTWNLLEACRLNSATVKRVIIASSDKAYGDQEILPYTEDAPLRGLHPYDMSKSCTDLLAQTYYNTYGLPVCITRCGNIYGPGDLNYNRLIPGTIQAVLKNAPIIIRSDGTLKRDYLYVKDAVSAYVTLGEKLIPLQIAGEAFNFSSGLRISVMDMTKEILSVMGREDHEITVLGKNKGEIRDQYLSSEKARTRLGWLPRYSLQEALRETVASYT